MRSWVRFPPGTEFSTCLFTFRHIRSVRNYPIFVSAERTTCIPHCLTANHSSSLCMYHMPFNLSKALSIVVENFMPCRVRWSGCARNLIFEARCRARNGSRDQTQMWNRLDWVAYMTTVEYKKTGSCPSWSWVRQIKIRSTTFKKKNQIHQQKDVRPAPDLQRFWGKLSLYMASFWDLLCSIMGLTPLLVQTHNSFFPVFRKQPSFWWN